MPGRHLQGGLAFYKIHQVYFQKTNKEKYFWKRLSSNWPLD
jgi:hypothetical protein